MLQIGTSSFFSVFLCCLGGFTGFQGQSLFAQESAPAGGPDPAIRIVVISGQNGVNVLKTKTAVQPIVEIRDPSNRPLPAALVTFAAPDSDPGVIFSNGSRLQSVVSEMDGRATVTEVQPVGLGPFNLTVTAVYDQHFASTTIEQTNFLTAAAAISAAKGPGVEASPVIVEGVRTGLSTHAKYGIIAGIAVAAAVGIAVGLTRRKSSATSSSGTIGAGGTPTVGAPH